MPCAPTTRAPATLGRSCVLCARRRPPRGRWSGTPVTCLTMLTATTSFTSRAPSTTTASARWCIRGTIVHTVARARPCRSAASRTLRVESPSSHARSAPPQHPSPIAALAALLPPPNTRLPTPPFIVPPAARRPQMLSPLPLQVQCALRAWAAHACSSPTGAVPTR